MHLTAIYIYILVPKRFLTLCNLQWWFSSSTNRRKYSTCTPNCHHLYTPCAGCVLDLHKHKIWSCIANCSVWWLWHYPWYSGGSAHIYVMICDGTKACMCVRAWHIILWVPAYIRLHYYGHLLPWYFATCTVSIKSLWFLPAAIIAQGWDNRIYQKMAYWWLINSEKL